MVENTPASSWASWAEYATSSGLKNNCPMSGPLYDDVRFDPLSGERDGKYFVVTLDSPHERAKWVLTNLLPLLLILLHSRGCTTDVWGMNEKFACRCHLFR